MEVYRSFIFRLVRNYLIGSLTAVFVVGTVIMVSTLQMPNVQYVRLIIIVLISLLFRRLLNGLLSGRSLDSFGISLHQSITRRMN